MSNNITRLLTALVGATDQGAGLQGLEDAMTALLTQTDLDHAVGAQLLIIAKLVGQDPSGLDDNTLRAYCRARIQAHRSRGGAESIIKVAKLVVDNSTAVVKLQPEGTATLRVSVLNVPVTNAVAAVVYLFDTIAVAAGVHLIFEWTTVPFAQTFRFDVGPGFDSGHLANQIG